MEGDPEHDNDPIPPDMPNLTLQGETALVTETIVGLWWEISFTVITSHLDADCMYHKQCHSQFPQVRRRHAAHEKTDLRRAAETTMHDCWTIGGALDLSDERTGSTRFQVLRPRLLPNGWSVDWHKLREPQDLIPHGLRYG